MATGGQSELPANTPIPGKVKAWMEEKGFGFVTPDNGGPDVFVHRNQLSDGQSLQTGSAVTIECRLNVVRGKYEATNCTGAVPAPLGSPAAAAAAAAAGGLSAAAGAALPSLAQLGLSAGLGAGGLSALSGAAALNVAGGAQAQLGAPGVLDNLFVAGLPGDITEDGVRDLFKQYGTVQQCKVLPDIPDKPDRAALVRMQDESQARWMVENLNGNIPLGMTKPLTVRFAGDRPVQEAYGKVGTPGLDNRFLPYGDASGLAGAGLGQLGTDALGVAGVPGVDMSQLQTMQLLQSLQGAGGLYGQAGLTASTLGFPGGMAGLPGMQAGLGTPGFSLDAATTAAATTAAAAATAAAANPTAATATAAAAAPAAGGAAAPAAQSGPWLEAKDPNSGRSYYYHSVTRETRWERPAEMG